jgi:hypothetical protein
LQLKEDRRLRKKVSLLLEDRKGPVIIWAHMSIEPECLLIVFL